MSDPHNDQDEADPELEAMVRDLIAKACESAPMVLEMERLRGDNEWLRDQLRQLWVLAECAPANNLTAKEVARRCQLALEGPNL